MTLYNCCSRGGHQFRGLATPDVYKKALYYYTMYYVLGCILGIKIDSCGMVDMTLTKIVLGFLTFDFHLSES